VGFFLIPEKPRAMDTVRHKTGLSRLPSLAAIFVALVCAAILGMSGWGEWSARETRLHDAGTEMANLARSLTQHAEDSLDLLDSGIVGVVSRLEMDGTGPATISKLRNLLDARRTAIDRIHGLAVIDEHGNWLTWSGAVTSELNGDQFFQQHLRSPSKEPFTGPPVSNSADGEWIITLSRRFNHRDGSFGGVVLGTVSASYLSKFYGNFEVGRHSAITLLYADGHVIARNPDNAKFVGRDLSHKPLFTNLSLQPSSGTYNFISEVTGMQRVSFFRRSDRFPLILLATVQYDELLAPWRNAAISRMSFVLALVMLIAVIGFFLVRQAQRAQHLARVLGFEEANFRLLAEGSSDMVTRIGLDDLVSYASPSSVRIVGWRPDQLVGRSALAGINPLDLPAARETVERLKRGEIEEARTTHRTRHREKGEIWIESTLRVTRKDNGEIDGAVAITRDVTEQKDLAEKLETLATEDGLTGVANRRRFDERVLEEWSRACRERASLGLLIVDLDHFKKYNDEYGHPAGDQCLRIVAGILAAEARRPADLAARYGGEEFAMLLPNTDAAGCARIAERVRRALRAAAIPHAPNQPCGLVTASIGGAICRPGVERSARPALLIEAADRALYAAKAAGRDRLVMAAELVTFRPLVSA
jgi:diguanylate cyclase (GGDEF)-like protein/PAS domain S-box-containing protein